MIRCGLMICLYAGFALSGVAQGEQVYDPRDHLPDQLSEVLDFEPFTKGGPSNKEHGWSARAICIFPETSFADSLDKQLAYLSCLRNTARAVQRAVERRGPSIAPGRAREPFGVGDTDTRSRRGLA